MKRREFLRNSALALAGVTLGCPAAQISEDRRRGSSGRLPNLVFVMADDMGYGDAACYDPQFNKVPTPNIDRLAKQGVRFTNAHTPSAVCSPTRYGILTGRYP